VPVRSLSPADPALRSKTSVHHYDGSNVDLGTASGKLYRVGVMSIQDAGDSDLVSRIPNHAVWHRR
jgi:large subunit ribosomal protein L30e